MSSWCESGTCIVPIEPTSRPDENDLPAPFQITALMSRRIASSSSIPNSCASISSSNALCLSGLSLTIVAIAPSTSSRTVPAIGAQHRLPAATLTKEQLRMTNPMGHGVNQRDLIKMTPAEVDAFLAERHSMTMSTISRDGSIHSVAMWYGFLEGAVAFETKAKAQKVTNLRRDPRLTCLVEDGESYDELRGVSLVGRGEIIDDPDRLWELGVSVFERYNAPYTEE